MSERHKGEKKFNVLVDDSLMAFDEAIKGRYKSRTEWLRERIRQEVYENPERPDVSCNVHSGKLRFDAWISVELLDELDKRLEQRNYNGRTEWLREKMWLEITGAKN